MSEKSGLMLSEAIQQMREAIRNFDLSDSFLEKESDSPPLRDWAFCGEWSYGITMVPCTFALQLAEKVLKAEGDQFIPYDPQ